MNILNTIVCSGMEIDILIPKLTSIVVKLITIAIPVILIIFCMIDLLKAVMAQNDEYKDILKKLTNRIKYGILVFLLPSIVTFILNLLIVDKQTFTCVDCFIRGDCSGEKTDHKIEEEPDDDEVIALIVTPASSSIEIGETLQLKANLSDLNYTSSNEDILTVTKEGMVTGVREGTAFVVVKKGKSSTQVRIVVTNHSSQNVAVETLGYESSSYDMIVGSTENYTPTLTPSNADASTISYTSSKPKVATVNSNGDVSALSEGTTVITATSGKSETKVKINVVLEEIEVPVKAISMISSVNLKIGETKQLEPIIQPSDATNQNIAFSSDNPKVVSVDNKGLITALNEGKANIYAKIGDKIAITTVVVTKKEIAVDKVTVSKSKVSIKVGDTYSVKPTIKPVNTTNQTVTYSSSNQKIATVDKKGLVTGKKAGTVTITVKSADGKKSSKVKVEVVNSHKIHFIQTSVSSDCILLESNGHYGLIDTGRSSDYKTIRNYLEKLNIKKIDFVLITHHHGDHFGSAYQIIKQYKPTTLYLKKYYANDVSGNMTPDYPERATKRYHKYVDIAKEIGTKIIYLDQQSEGYSFKLGSMKLKNYNLINHMKDGSIYAHSSSENVNSITTLVTIGNYKTYLGSDLSADLFADAIAEKVGKVDVYKVIHHGILNGTSEREASFLRPAYVIVTNSKKELNSRPEGNAIPRITPYTNNNNVYYSSDYTVVVDYSSSSIKISKK